MPYNKYALARYALIDDLLNQRQYVKTKDIVEACRTKLGCTISQRSIQMDIFTMQNDSFIGYYAPIKYDNSRKAYYYEESDSNELLMGFSQNERKLLKRIFIVMEGVLTESEYRNLIHIVSKIKYNR